MGRSRIDLTGQTFNRLTVDHFLGMTRAGGTLWECICICSTRVPATGHGLKNGATNSCGCLAKEVSRQNALALNRGRVLLRPYEARYRHVQRSATRRGVPCGLTYETFCGLVAQTQCHYCYGELPVRLPYGGRVATQLDRKDNSQGYEESNVVSCCSGCNAAKGRKSYEFAITQRELWRQLRGDRMSDTPLEKPKRVYTNAARFVRRSVPHTQEIDFATSSQTAI